MTWRDRAKAGGAPRRYAGAAGLHQVRLRRVPLRPGGPAELADGLRAGALGRSNPERR